MIRSEAPRAVVAPLLRVMTQPPGAGSTTSPVAYRRPVVLSRRGQQSRGIHFDDPRTKLSLPPAVTNDRDDLRALPRWIWPAAPLDHTARRVGVGDEAEARAKGGLRREAELDAADQRPHRGIGLPRCRIYIHGPRSTPSSASLRPVSQPRRRCASFSPRRRRGTRSSALGRSHSTYASGQSVTSYPRPRST